MQSAYKPRRQFKPKGVAAVNKESQVQTTLLEYGRYVDVPNWSFVIVLTMNTQSLRCLSRTQARCLSIKGMIVRTSLLLRCSY